MRMRLVQIELAADKACLDDGPLEPALRMKMWQVLLTGLIEMATTRLIITFKIIL